MHATDLPFRFDMQVEVFEKAGADPDKERRIGGMVTTDHMDKHGEILIQEGLDFQPFLKGGWFNDNHDQTTSKIVGYPEFAQMRELPNGHKGWYVEGHMLKGHAPADELWNVANALQKSGRRLGFSVEGGIQQRDTKHPQIVRKAVVKEVAVTRCPVNDNTSLDVLAKSLAAGHAVSDPGVAPGEGFPLRTESLEGGKKKRKKKYRKSEAVDLLIQTRPGLPRAFAEHVVDYAFRWHGAT